MKSKIKIMILIILMFLAICLAIVLVFKKYVVGTGTTVDQKWIRNWVETPVCTPPCWENITPNKTIIDDVPRLLSQVEGFSNITEPELVVPPVSRCVTWDAQYIQGGSGGVGSICTNSETDDFVGEINLVIDYYNPQIRIKDIQKKFGDPTYFGIYKEQQFCYPGLVYQDKGMILILQDINLCRRIKITENMKVGLIYFMDPNNPKLLGKFGPEKDGVLYQWKGYTYYPPKP
jgi:hypothetical protein